MLRLSVAMSTLCTNQALVKSWGSDKEVSHLPCRSWLCDRCQPKRRTQKIAHILSGKPNRFLTVTWRVRDGFQVADVEKILTATFKAFVRKYRKLHGGVKPAYHVTVEYTKNGWPHLHVFWRGPWVDFHELQDFMDEAIDSPRVNVKAIDNRGRAAAYAAKYTTKEYRRMTTGKRYYSTPDYDLTRVKGEDGKWRSPAQEDGWAGKPDQVFIDLQKHPQAYVDYYTGNGFRFHYLGSMKWSTRAPPIAIPAAQQQQQQASL